ncbi:MAG: DUF3987 domain-containing protein [Pseudoxanthomonas sp.]
MNAVMVETPKDAARRLCAAVVAAGFQPNGLHEYRDADGNPVFWKMRCKHPRWHRLDEAERERLQRQYKSNGAKWLRPMYWTGVEYVIGEPPAPATGKLLYRQPELLAADGVVWIVEGEACADRLAKLGLIATTSGSSASADGADWTPLQGRHAILWPDHDDAGAKYADAVQASLHALGCVVERVDVAALDLPAKGDCVDWLAAHPGATAADVEALARITAKPEAARAAGSAPEPLPEPLPAVPVFNPALLPDAVRAWCQDAADGLQVPLDFTAVPAMVGLAAAIGGRHIAVKLKRNAHWYERPILWGCVIGRPSSGKSPALSPVRRALESVLDGERAEYKVALQTFEGMAMLAEARKSEAKDKARKAIKQGHAVDPASLAESARFDEEPPTEPRLVVNDSTVEKLGELLNENPRGLIQFRDELAGWLASMDREGRESDRAFWLECWNGTGPYTSDRIGRGTIRVEACAVSILGGMQPGKLAEYVRGAVRGGFADDGLMQRFQLAVYPDLPGGWRYSDRPLNREAEDRARAAFQRLRALNPVNVGAETADTCEVPFLRLSDDAQDIFIEWYTELMQRLRQGDEPAFMESHLAKYSALAGRLALVLHLTDNGTGPVSGEAMVRALGWCEYLEGHARRIYAPVTDTGVSAAHLLLKKQASLPDSFTARDVYRKCWAGLDDPETAAGALETLVEYRHLIEMVETTGGRPTCTYRWAT